MKETSMRYLRDQYPALYRYPCNPCLIKTICLVIGLLLVSCAKVHLLYPPETSLVRIHPDQATHTLPALQYHFYSVDGQACIVRSGDDRGNFEGELPVGTYRVIATNIAVADAGNVRFEAMDSYETATVTALPAQPAENRAQPTLNAQLSTLNSIDSVYALVVPELSVVHDLTVTASETPLYKPEPVLLTKTVNLRFVLESGLGAEVNTLRGVFRGIYPSVNLCSRNLVANNSGAMDASAMAFDAKKTADGWEAALSLFGLCDPKYGQVYENTLTLTLTFDERSEEIAISLTEALSDVFAQYGGHFSGTLPLVITIRHDLINYQAGVTVWEDSGRSGETISEK